MSLAMPTTFASMVSATQSNVARVFHHPHGPVHWWGEQHRPVVSRHIANMKPEPSSTPSSEGSPMVSLQKREDKTSTLISTTTATSVSLHDVLVTVTVTKTVEIPGATKTLIDEKTLSPVTETVTITRTYNHDNIIAPVATVTASPILTVTRDPTTKILDRTTTTSLTFTTAIATATITVTTISYSLIDHTVTAPGNTVPSIFDHTVTGPGSPYPTIIPYTVTGPGQTVPTIIHNSVIYTVTPPGQTIPTVITVPGLTNVVTVAAGPRNNVPNMVTITKTVGGLHPLITMPTIPSVITRPMNH